MSAAGRGFAAVWPSLPAWLAASLATGAAGAIASRDAQSFYLQLARPDWAPPAAVFGPVWTALYLMMGISAWLVWRQRGRAAGPLPYAFFILQLAANGLWSWLFFAWRQGALAFGEILLLLALILATVISFWRIRPLAGALLLPYLAWVGFAAALTWSVWRNNPGLL